MPRTASRTHADYVKLIGTRDVAFEPGAKFEYSSYGFMVLGAIIEKVTGTSYYDAVDELVYRPAGMTATGSLPEEDMVPGRAIGYTRETLQHPWKSNVDTLPYRGTATGGGYSTVTDLLAFANALTKYRLLDQTHTRVLTSGKVAYGDAVQYTYGFEEWIEGGIRSVGHHGGGPGSQWGALHLRLGLHRRRPGQYGSPVRPTARQIHYRAVAGEMRAKIPLARKPLRKSRLNTIACG